MISRSNSVNQVVKNSYLSKSVISQSDSRVSRNRNVSNVSKLNTLYKAVNSKIGSGGSLDTSKFKYNQSPVETPDGVIVNFTLPNSDEFITGLIEVFINGNQKIKGVEWQENGATGITLIGSYATTPPTSDEVIKFNYIKT